MSRCCRSTTSWSTKVIVPLSAMSASPCIAARWLALPASRATGSRNWSTQSSAPASLASGSISLLGQDITHSSVRFRREHGVGYIPQDRQAEGLLLQAPLWENAALGHQTRAPFCHGFWMDREGMRTATEHIRKAFDVRTPNIDVAAHALSGGNQQKLIVGREMSANPTMLIASHPTRGIDVGAQAAVWDQLRAARAAGLATLLISADLDELIGLSDTIVVMLRGRLVATLDPAKVTPRDLGAYMTGAALQAGAA